MKKEYIKPTSYVHLYLSQALMAADMISQSDVDKGTEGDFSESKRGGSSIWDNFDSGTED